MNKKGFTLIELVIVIVILGIIAAIAVPTYVNLKTQAELNGMKASLGSIRSAVSLQHSNNLINSGTDAYPSNISGTLFSDGDIPIDPINSISTVVTSNVTPLKGNATGTVGGWIYNPTTGEARCNHTSYDEY
jgi:prepilin-type N-terminal cleavage/methylation domain-containing protein